MRIGPLRRGKLEHNASGCGSKSIFPADPFAEAAAHHVLELPALQPCELFGKEIHALPVAAGHAGDVGAEEEALGSERVEDAVQPVLDVGIRIA